MKVHFDEPMSKKSIVILFGTLALFCWLLSLTIPRISREHIEVIIVLIVEVFVIICCLGLVGSEWFPRNFKPSYIWYWTQNYNGTRRNVVGHNSLDGEDITKTPICFQVKTSGWFAKNQVLINGHLGKNWKIEVLKQPRYSEGHKLILIDKDNRPLCVDGHSFDAIEYLFWVIEHFADLTEYWSHMYEIDYQHRDLIYAMTVLEEAGTVHGTLGNVWQAKVVHDFAAHELDRIIPKLFQDEALLTTDDGLSCKRSALGAVLLRTIGRPKFVPVTPVIRQFKDSPEMA
ncbi:hypothetical protein HON36_03555 [Candidatus Parcubacteria bacterium]|jgi:hypothetical protein|nr:hypothetical protein [Candidatus Parcubacteria bacterium]MBT7228361.1 hypothetical protein [Candidatus Parcubacteria bacterium]